VADEVKDGAAGTAGTAATTDPERTGGEGQGDKAGQAGSDGAQKPQTVSMTQAELDAERARVRKTTEAETRKRVEREFAAKGKPVDEQLADMKTELEATKVENESMRHVSRALVESAKAGFTSETYIRRALAQAISDNPESIDYKAVAKSAVALAREDGLVPVAAAGAGEAEGADTGGSGSQKNDDGAVSANQRGASSRNAPSIAGMDRVEMLQRSVSDPEWRKNVFEPHLKSLKEKARAGLKE
jgi:hypothetical protein